MRWAVAGVSSVVPGFARPAVDDRTGGSRVAGLPGVGARMEGCRGSRQCFRRAARSGSCDRFANDWAWTNCATCRAPNIPRPRSDTHPSRPSGNARRSSSARPHEIPRRIELKSGWHSARRRRVRASGRVGKRAERSRRHSACPVRGTAAARAGRADDWRLSKNCRCGRSGSWPARTTETKRGSTVRSGRPPRRPGTSKGPRRCFDGGFARLGHRSHEMTRGAFACSEPSLKTSRHEVT